MRRGRIMINPHKSDDGLWYADAWYGVLDSDQEESIFKRVTSTDHRDLEHSVLNAKQAALQLLQKQGIEEKQVVLNIIWPEEE